MEKINQLIEIVYDPRKRRLRARCIQDGRWCRFPNKLRIENKVFKAAKMKKGRGDSWIASGPSEFNLSEKNSEIEDLLGLKNKAILKKFYDVIISNKSKPNPKINTEMLNIIFTLKNIFPEINEQLIEPLIKKYSHNAFIQEDLIVDVRNMLMNYNEKRVVSLFSNYEEDDFLEDTTIMYKQLFENDILIDDILPKKPKNIRELHTLFTRECRKIKQPKSLLNQNLEYLLNKKVDDFRIFIPETTFDLIDIGNSLSICVGNGYYAKKVLSKKCNIISLKDLKGNFKFCIEYDNHSIIQARGWANQSMDKTLQAKLYKIIREKPQKAA